ncbi:MAG: amidohydrolase family protein [Paracoccaceae bacterium]
MEHAAAASFATQHDNTLTQLTSPAAPDSPFRPIQGGNFEAYLRMHKLLCLERAIVVQPSAYGTDNRCTMDAVARLGDCARAVVVVDETVADAELLRLTESGARGLRFFMLPGGVLGWDVLASLAARISTYGWHRPVQLDGLQLHVREAEIAALPCPVVIDHNGKFLEPVETDHPGFMALCRLIDAGKAWVKTSGVYETSHDGFPNYSDVSRLAQALIQRFPERCVWATNWPHPSKPNDAPDDAHLLDLFAQWCGSDVTLRRILVENPQKLYDF